MATWYVIRYAITRGIQEIEEDGDKCYIWKDEYLVQIGGGFFKIGRDVVPTRAEAIAAAKALRDKKVAALERQISRLKKLEFV